MQVNKDDLIAVLTKLAPGLGKKEFGSQFSCFLFDGEFVLTFNETIAIIAKSPIDFVGAVYANELLTLLKKTKTETLDISEDAGTMLIKAGRSKSGIRFEKELRMPTQPMRNSYAESTKMDIPAGLLPAMQRAKFCASGANVNLDFSGVYVADGHVVATNGYRLISVCVAGMEDVLPFIIPADCVSSVVEFSPVKMAVSESWAYFANEAEDLIFCCRLLASNDKYSQVDNILQVDGTEITLPVDILPALEKTDIFVSGKTDFTAFVNLSFKKGRVVIRGEGEFGWHEDTVPLPGSTVAGLSFNTNPEFLRDILPVTNKAILGESTVLFEGDNFKHVFVRSAYATDSKDTED